MWFSFLMGKWGALAPGQCAFCHAWPAQTVCGACMESFARPQPRCRLCALPLPGAAGAVCGHCLRQPPPLEGCMTAVDYQWPWTQAITAFKFSGRTGWVRTFAAMLQAAPGMDDVLAQVDLVLPMPLTTKRLRQRGFNQSLLLARALAGHERQRVRHDVLQRVRETAPQASLPRQRRHRNVRSAFAVAPHAVALVRDARVLLVDDVMTTGASMYEAAQALRKGGAQSVVAACVARTPSPPLRMFTHAPGSATLRA